MTSKNLKKAMEILQGNINEESIQAALIHLKEHENQVTIIQNISLTKTEVFNGFQLTNKTQENENKRMAEELI